MRLTLLLLAFLPLAAQDVLALSAQLRDAVTASNWAHAAALSQALQAATRAESDRFFAASNPPAIARALAWLPESTESLIVGQQPFRLERGQQSDPPGALVAARGFLLSQLSVLESKKTASALEGKTIRYTILASRRFAEYDPGPTGAIPLGLISMQSCAIYAFANPLLDTLFQRAPDTTVNGQSVWLSTGSRSMPARNAKPVQETYYATFLGENHLLACNNQDFLSSILLRKSNVSATPPFTAWPEWAQVDRAAPLWAIRHFAPGPHNADPTHPANGAVLGV